MGSNLQIENILNEASSVLNAALKHSSELSEAGITSKKLFHMRLLITQITLHNIGSVKSKSSLPKELQELQKVKDIILKTAEQRFISNTKALSEFRPGIHRKTD